MKDLVIKYLGALVLEQSSKGELINKVLQLQERDKELMDKLTNLYQSKREAGEDHKETIEEYKKRIEELLKKLAHYEVVAEETLITSMQLGLIKLFLF
jgi:adenylate kinase family enzyme